MRVITGFDADGSANLRCSAKAFHGGCAASLLFCYGGTPNRLSVCPDGKQRCLDTADGLIKKQLDQITQSDGIADARYVAAKCNDILQECNHRIYESAKYLGQRISLGGVLLLVHETHYISIPFGGGISFLWDGSQLILRGNPPEEDGLIRDALGSGKNWKGKFWQGEIPPEGHLIALTNLPPDPDEAKRCVSEGILPESHANTLAMLLRRNLESRNAPAPNAVLDIHF